MPSELVLFWSWIMEGIKWKKQQDGGDHVAEVVQKEQSSRDPNVLGEDDAVDPAVENEDVPAAEEDEAVPLLEGEEEEEDVQQVRAKRNRHFCHHLFKFLRDVIQNSFCEWLNVPFIEQNWTSLNQIS